MHVRVFAALCSARVATITFPSELHMPGNHLTRNFITYKKSANKTKKGFLCKNHVSKVGGKNY